MLISGGENVYPAEIEYVLLAHDDCRCRRDRRPVGQVGGVPLGRGGRRDPTLTAAEVIEFCTGKLAPFKAVKAVEFVTELPRNASGKILKRELRLALLNPARRCVSEPDPREA